MLIPIRGEYSFILYHTITKQIIFGRDRLGRRSLILSASEDHFGVVSVGVIKGGAKFKSLALLPVYTTSLLEPLHSPVR